MRYTLYLLFVSIFQCISLYDAKTARVYNANCKNASLVRIAMLGDSLMRRPMEYYNLPDQIHSYLMKLNPQLTYNIVYNTTAIDGSQIEAIREQQVQPVLEWKPDAWIMYWDTGKISRIHFH